MLVLLQLATVHDVKTRAGDQEVVQSHRRILLFDLHVNSTVLTVCESFEALHS